MVVGHYECLALQRSRVLAQEESNEKRQGEKQEDQDVQEDPKQDTQQDTQQDPTEDLSTCSTGGNIHFDSIPPRIWTYQIADRQWLNSIVNIVRSEKGISVEELSRRNVDAQVGEIRTLLEGWVREYPQALFQINVSVQGFVLNDTPPFYPQGSEVTITGNLRGSISPFTNLS